MSQQSSHTGRPRITFFGSSQFSIYILDEMLSGGFTPDLIITTPDKPAGRKLVLTPTPVKVWAQQHNIPVLDPGKLDAVFIENFKATLTAALTSSATLFIVASYGKIIPQSVLDIPSKQTLNVHPSLLPKYRGASPLQSAMLDDAKHTGVTIMLMDALMDHGPILAQTTTTVTEWPEYEVFEQQMAVIGGKLLIETIPGWIAGTISPKEQDHSQVTLTRKITKQDAEIKIEDIVGTTTKQHSTLSYEIFRKIQAYHEWPTAYFFISKNIGTNNDNNAAIADDAQKLRIKITKATPSGIERVIPEGKNEMSWSDFRAGYKI